MRARPNTLAIAFLALLAAGPGCDDRHIAWDRPLTVIGPIRMKDRIAYVNSARDRVVSIDFSGEAPRFHLHSIGRRAIFAAPTPDQERLAVLTRGEEALVAGMVDEDPALWLVEVGDPAAAPQSYPLGSPFDRLAVAADGTIAVAYFSTAEPDDSGVFHNPNEIAVIDLLREPGQDNPVHKTVRSFGSAPDGVVLAPPMQVPGAPDQTPRIFAFVLSLDTLTVIDATYPERNEASIRIGGTGDGVRPRAIVFDPASATAYLRSDNARDVLEVLIRHQAPSERNPRDNDFRPAVAELGAGAGPADIAVYDDLDGRRRVFAATPGTRQVVIIDAATGQFTSVDTPDPIDRVLLFPSSPDLTPRIALLASLGSPRSRVFLLPLDGVTDELVPARLNSVELSEPVLDVVPVPGRELAMIVHDDARTVLGLLDVALGSVAPLQGVGRLDTFDFSAGGGHLLGATRAVSRVGFVDLDSLHPSDMRLDDPPVKVFALSGGSVFIDHGDPLGRATWMPSPSARRADSVVLSGFLLANLLDEDF
jgi:hypothetical protein